MNKAAGGSGPIYIKCLTGETLSLDCNPELDTIDQIKAKLQEIKGPIESLLFAGQQLKNGHYLSDYNIEIKSTLHLVLDLRGGGAPTFRCINVATGAAYSLCFSIRRPTLAHIVDAIKNQDRNGPSDAKLYKILTYCGIDCSTRDMSTEIRDLPFPKNHPFSPLTVTFVYLHGFKDIVRQFRTSGAMADTLLAMLTVGSIDDIRAAQDINHIIRVGTGGQKLTHQVVLTMLGIKILREFFAAD